MAKVQFNDSVYKVNGQARPNISYTITNEFIGLNAGDGSFWVAYKNGILDNIIYTTETISDVDKDDVVVLTATQIEGYPFKAIRENTSVALPKDIDYIITENADGTAKIVFKNQESTTVYTVLNYTDVILLFQTNEVEAPFEPTAAQNGQTLVWNEVAQAWEFATISGGGVTPDNPDAGYVDIYDASTGVVPTTGNGPSNSILKGDYWLITTAGTIPGIGDLEIGDVIYATIDGASTGSEFFAVQANQTLTGFLGIPEMDSTTYSVYYSGGEGYLDIGQPNSAFPTALGAILVTLDGNDITTNGSGIVNMRLQWSEVFNTKIYLVVTGADVTLNVSDSAGNIPILDISNTSSDYDQPAVLSTTYTLKAGVQGFDISTSQLSSNVVYIIQKLGYAQNDLDPNPRSLRIGATDPATVTGIKDEDDMLSDSATALATQQSIKAYVDNTFVNSASTTTFAFPDNFVGTLEFDQIDGITQAYLTSNQASYTATLFSSTAPGLCYFRYTNTSGSDSSITFNSEAGEDILDTRDGSSNPSVVFTGLNTGESHLFVIFNDENSQFTIEKVGGIGDYVDFPAIAPPTYLEGRVFYDTNNKSFSYYNDEADVTVNIGQENVIRVRNTTGVTITNGQAVYISGAQGVNLPLVSLAKADALDTSRCIGLAAHDIENNTNGYITTLGLVGDLNTSAFTAGDPLFLSTTTAGALTATRPTSGYAVVVGYVTVSNASVGEVKVIPGTTVQNATLWNSDSTFTAAAGTEIQNTATSDISGQTVTAAFDFLNVDITTVGRTASGEVNFLNFNKDGSNRFRINTDGDLLLFDSAEIRWSSGQFISNAGVDRLRFSNGSAQQLDFLNTGRLVGTSGTVGANIYFVNSALTYTFRGNTTHGIGMNDTTKDLFIQTNGVNGLEIDATQNVTIPNGDLYMGTAKSPTILSVDGAFNTPTILTDQSATTTGISGDGDTINFISAGINRMNIDSNSVEVVSRMQGSVSTRWRLDNSTATATSPNIIHNRSSATTGIGGIAGTVSLITGGIEGLTVDATQDVTIPNGSLLASTTLNTGSHQVALASGGRVGYGGATNSHISFSNTLTEVRNGTEVKLSAIGGSGVINLDTAGINALTINNTQDVTIPNGNLTVGDGTFTALLNMLNSGGNTLVITAQSGNNLLASISGAAGGNVNFSDFETGLILPTKTTTGDSALTTNGAIVYNSFDHTLKARINGTWEDLQAGGSSSSGSLYDIQISDGSGGFSTANASISTAVANLTQMVVGLATSGNTALFQLNSNSTGLGRIDVIQDGTGDAALRLFAQAGESYVRWVDEPATDSFAAGIDGATGDWAITYNSAVDALPSDANKRITIDSVGMAFFASSPVAQPSGTGETVGFTAGTGTGVNDDSTFTGNVGTTAYRISDVVKALKNLGLLAS